MATLLKHSSHLSSCDTSKKATQCRKLRSRKITVVNENLSNVKIGTRSKKLHTTIKSTSKGKNKSNKIHKDNDESNKIERIERSKKQENKTPNKKRNNINNTSVKKNKTTTNSTVLRQMSLKKAFTHQSLSQRLRPRQKKKNYCEDSKFLHQHLSPQLQNSKVILEKLDLTDIKNVPIYKTIKKFEVSSENKNDIYNFEYDINDTKEKLVKKRRKRNINKTKKVSKIVRKKAKVQSKAIDREANKSLDTNFPAKIQSNPSLEPVLISSPVTTESKEDMLKVAEIPKIDKKVEINETISSDQISVEHIKKQDIKKPKIISIENVNNITITMPSPRSSQDFRPFRPTNIFDNKAVVQNEKTSNCPSLMKSLSPISKMYDTFDPGSPWRPPTLSPIFSQSKNFAQSTPNINKMNTVRIPKKHITHINDFRNCDKVSNVSDVILKNVNSSIQNVSDKTNHIKQFDPCRKFGTEITNIEYFNNGSIVQNNNVEIINEKLVETETIPISNVPLDAIAPMSSSYLSNDNMDDKENTIPNDQTLKKQTKKKIRKQHLNSSPSKICEKRNYMQQENIDPQPGPSGIKNLKNLNDQKILCQSNLNNFLNLMDIPENTRINTKHGIFSDTYSTPINSNINKASRLSIEIENAFGFCENESESDALSIKDKFISDQIPNENLAMCANKPVRKHITARLSLGELKNQLRPKKPYNNANNKQKTNQKDVEVNKPLMTQQNNNVEMVNFSDTFDVLSESEKLSNCEANVSLFVDSEPSHFSKPAQHSYKRKRAVTFNFSEDSSEEEEKIVKEHTKKKKFTKLDKENKKRLNEWVKNINSTFEEIDEHDLLIE